MGVHEESSPGRAPTQVRHTVDCSGHSVRPLRLHRGRRSPRARKERLNPMPAPCQTTPTPRRLARWPFSCKWPRWYLAGPCIGVGCRPGGGVSDHGLRNLLALCESQGEVVGLRDHCCGLCWSNLMQNLGQPMRRRAHPCASQRTHCYKFDRPSAAERLQSLNSSPGRPPAWRGACVARGTRVAIAHRGPDL